MEIECRAMEVLLPFPLAALLLAAMVVNACEVGLTAPEPGQTYFFRSVKTGRFHIKSGDYARCQ